MQKKYLSNCEPETFEKMFIDMNEEIYNYRKSTFEDDNECIEAHSIIKTSLPGDGERLDEFFSYKFDYYKNSDGIVYVTKYDLDDEEIWSKKIEM